MKNTSFEKNILILNELFKYAPTEDKLLHVPDVTNIVDLFILWAMKAPSNSEVNYLTIALNLLSHLRSINRVLSRLYAAHQFILKNREESFDINLNQSNVDLKIVLNSLIIEEYSYTLREFISSLRVIVDQLILIETANSSKFLKQCDSIGDFLKTIIENESKYNKKFLVGLNAAGNYLKHHPYQLEAPTQIFNLLTPSLLILVAKSNRKSKFDYENIKNFFKSELDYNNEAINIWISIEFLIKGFNEFYKLLQTST